MFNLEEFMKNVMKNDAYQSCFETIQKA